MRPMDDDGELDRLFAAHKEREVGAAAARDSRGPGADDPVTVFDTVVEEIIASRYEQVVTRFRAEGYEAEWKRGGVGDTWITMTVAGPSTLSLLHLRFVLRGDQVEFERGVKAVTQIVPMGPPDVVTDALIETAVMDAVKEALS
jgi:hypothetical protein